MSNLTREVLRKAGLDVSKARIAVLGYAYLEDSDDVRNSPTKTLGAELEALGAQVMIHDPRVPEFNGDVWECVNGCDAAVVMAARVRSGAGAGRRFDLSRRGRGGSGRVKVVTLVGARPQFIKKIAPPTEQEKRALVMHILKEYRSIAEYHAIVPAIVTDYPIIQVNNCHFNVETLTFEGQEDEETDDFRDYVRKWGFAFLF